MELIKISDSKLKIALTPTDMEKYSLDIQTMDYDKTETRSAFWQLLDEAKHKTGFDAASEKIFVQIYSSAGGGCEMYVTKLKRPPGILITGTIPACPLIVTGRPKMADEIFRRDSLYRTVRTQRTERADVIFRTDVICRTDGI